MSVRQTRAADLAELDVLFRRSYPVLLKTAYPPSVMVTVIPRLSRAQPDLVVSGTYYAVTDDVDRIVGAGGWARAGGRGRKAFGEIRHFVTDHARVRQGVGRNLMSRIVEEARGVGMTHLSCMSTMCAVPFYAACGFDVVGPISMPVVAGIDFQVMKMRRPL